MLCTFHPAVACPQLATMPISMLVDRLKAIRRCPPCVLAPVKGLDKFRVVAPGHAEKAVGERGEIIDLGPIRSSSACLVEQYSATSLVSSLAVNANAFGTKRSRRM